MPGIFYCFSTLNKYPKKRMLIANSMILSISTLKKIIVRVKKVIQLILILDILFYVKYVLNI